MIIKCFLKNLQIDIYLCIRKHVQEKSQNNLKKQSETQQVYKKVPKEFGDATDLIIWYHFKNNDSFHLVFQCKISHHFTNNQIHTKLITTILWTNKKLAWRTILNWPPKTSKSDFEIRCFDFKDITCSLSPLRIRSF